MIVIYICLTSTNVLQIRNCIVVRRVNVRGVIVRGRGGDCPVTVHTVRLWCNKHQVASLAARPPFEEVTPTRSTRTRTTRLVAIGDQFMI